MQIVRPGAPVLFGGAPAITNAPLVLELSEEILEAIDHLAENTSSTQLNIINEVDRYIDLIKTQNNLTHEQFVAALMPQRVVDFLEPVQVQDLGQARQPQLRRDDVERLDHRRQPQQRRSGAPS